MGDNNIDFLSDNSLADGQDNKEWAYALHLDCDENYYYIAVIERA